MKQIKKSIENIQEYKRQKQELIDLLEYYCDKKRHLVCKPYSLENLHLMAENLGIKRCWFHKNHYDIPKKRINDVTEKCRLVSPKDIVRIIRGRYNERKYDILDDGWRN